MPSTIKRIIAAVTLLSAGCAADVDDGVGVESQASTIPLRPEPRITYLGVNPGGTVEVTLEARGEGSIGLADLYLIADGAVAGALWNPGAGNHRFPARIFGENRQVGVLVDPLDDLAEASERNQSIARRISVPYDGRGDLTIVDLKADPLELLIENVGDGRSDATVANLKVFREGLLAIEQPVHLPALDPGEEVHAMVDYEVDEPALISVHFKLVDDDENTDADTTNNGRREHLPKGLDTSWIWSLMSRPEFEEAAVWVQDGEEHTYRDWPNDLYQVLERNVEELSMGRDPLGPRPVRPDEECPLTYGEALEVYLAYLAQSLWFEYHGPAYFGATWSLATLPHEQRRALLGSDTLVRPSPYADHAGKNCWVGTMHAWSPAPAMRFLRAFQKIRPSDKETVMHLGDFVRDHFEHGLTPTPNTAENARAVSELHWGTPYATVEGMLYAPLGGTNVSSGCGNTAHFLQLVLRTVNIPVERGRIEFHDSDGDGHPNPHSTVHFPSIGQHLVHGDDLYGLFGFLSYERDEVLPTRYQFVSEATFARDFESPAVDCAGGMCNPVATQRSVNAKRQVLERWATSLPTSLLLRVDAGERLEDIFRIPSTAVTPLISPEREAEILEDVDTRLRAWGDGDRTLGVERARWAHRTVKHIFSQLRLP